MKLASQEAAQEQEKNLEDMQKVSRLFCSAEIMEN